MSDLTHKKLQIALIVDSNSLDSWQFDAVANCQDLVEINTIIYCQNNQSKENTETRTLLLVESFFDKKQADKSNLLVKIDYGILSNN